MPIRHIHVTGVVQGVGFRPFVYQLATRLNLRGWVANTSAGVDIEVDGEPNALADFERALSDPPPLARIDSILTQDVTARDYPRLGCFEIRESVPLPGAFQPISPDISICPDCLRELFDPADRRYRYPFINCTNCGPRFTIIHDVPYDRSQTTMRAFPMCNDCAREYSDPLDRRFHAQPIACPQCGPKVWIQPTNPHTLAPNYQHPISSSRQLLSRGEILAVKGLGGFHLACSATDDRAVETLRARKGRVDKPFAVMAFDISVVEQFCYISDAERRLLESRERPIVLLRRRPDSPVSDHVAPCNNFLGMMLPYTPLHYLLLEPATDAPPLLVMTSGNISEEPIATDNAEALDRLAHLADYFLLHDREIATRADDSVVRILEECELPLRRSRGYAPYPVHLPFAAQPTLAVGSELKNTFCLTRDTYAFLSQHMGDLENYPALASFQSQIDHLKRLFRIEPEIVAHDLHPDYASTRYAHELTDKRLVPVQHHHAHIASAMAEHGLPDEPVIGVAFDGTGLGTDGRIWGGEFLLARYSAFTRAAHLAYVPLPGGDAGIHRVYRNALAQLAHAGLDWSSDLPCVAVASENERMAIRRQLETRINAPETCSMGRLFDAVAAIVGVREIVNYEAQAAIELEHWVVEDLEASYAFPLESSMYPIILDPAPLIRAIVIDYRAQVPPWVIASKFHNTIAALIRDAAVLLREREGLGRVVLTGGVFQNMMLLARALQYLRSAGFEVLTQRLVPPNDGGIALGQAAVAAHVG